jgi:hypothetical protein
MSRLATACTVNRMQFFASRNGSEDGRHVREEQWSRVPECQPHQPGSQDSILRDCPGGGGDSLKRMPLASLRVPGPKKLPPPCDASARGRKLRSAPRAVRLRTDMSSRAGVRAGGRGRRRCRSALAPAL